MTPPPRLTSAVQVQAIRRMIEGQGGYAMLLNKGDEGAGEIFLILEGHDADDPASGAYQRLPDVDGVSRWILVEHEPAALQSLIARRRARDPDLWVLTCEGRDCAAMAHAINALFADY